ncbi:MAG: BlaI/MecI/CopY family transcriptional regulator [Gemmatimonas sp.]|nr:BlaI/MecI/CopY family transcriptional regulator [Gemmatimonas sp.]
MARPTSPTLTEAELRLMKVIWHRGKSTTSEIGSVLAERDIELAGSTIRTILGILEDKGYLTSTVRGRSRVYRPLVTRSEARRSALHYFLTRFFDGSREELLLNLLGDEDVDDEELARLKELVLEEGRDDD